MSTDNAIGEKGDEAASGSARGTIPLVFSCDNAYGMQLATALRSMAEANRKWWPLDVRVLAAGILDDTREKVISSSPDGSVTLKWIPVDAGLFREFATMAHVSKVTFARLLIPQLFPTTVERVLYLDADLLVLDDLEELWHADLDGAILGAVLDGLDARIKSGLAGVDEAARVRKYFNAGVLLIDLVRWRKERISERALEYLGANPGVRYADQDALNVVCDCGWKMLDPRWNTQLDTGDKRIADSIPGRRPGIVHFVWNQKPWNAKVLNVNARFYDSFRQRTRFARSGPEKLHDTVQETWSRLKRTLRPMWRRFAHARC